MYNLETRYKSVVHYNHFLRSLRKVSKIDGVSKSSLQRWVKQSPTYHKQRPKLSLRNDIHKCILDQIHNNPFITIKELASIISSTCNLQRSRRTINRYVKSCNLTFKSAFRMVNVVHNNEKVKQFCTGYINSCDADSLISIDETGFYIGDHRKKGWCHKGKRLAIRGDKSLRRTKFTLILAISSKGIVGYTILDHNCKKVDFINFVHKLVIPEKSTVIMDNIPFHHSKEVVNALTAKGASLLYSLPYSPRINPIENVFGMLKPKYRERCPSYFNKQFDYKTCFENMMIRQLNGSLNDFFLHVRQIAKDTLSSIDADPVGFVFNGYDL
jgi:transposase